METNEEYDYDLIHNNPHEMIRIGWFDDFEVCIYCNEETIPHMHLRNIYTEKECCIKLNKPEYFFHESGDYFMLSLEQKNKLMTWLNSCLEIRHKVTNAQNWVWLCDLWDLNNLDNELETWVMPDYTLL